MAGITNAGIMGMELNRRQFLGGIAGAFGIVSTMTLAGCGSSSGNTQEKVYLEDTEIDAMFASPDDYRGKWVKLPGVTITSSARDGNTTFVQAVYDVTHYDKNFIVNSDTTETFGSNEYIVVDGRLDGTFMGTNSFGGTVSAPLVTAATITKSSYIEVVAPAIVTLEPNASAEENGLSFTCDKVEYADIETRVYLMVNNSREDTVNYGEYDIRIMCDGKQIAQDNDSQSPYLGNYPSLTHDVLPGASSEGILVFPPIDRGKDFQVVIPNIYCDDYQVQFDDITLEVASQ
ncbi:MAG: hypothetical protein ACOX4F_08845 [Atopobiaceae bacterium]|jgi:hypothetical protein